MKLLDRQACRARQRRLWQLVDAADHGADETRSTELLLVTHPKHVTYLANVHLWPFVFRSCDAPVALVLTRDRSVLFLDHNARMFAEGAAVDETISPAWYDGNIRRPHELLRCKPHSPLGCMTFAKAIHQVGQSEYALIKRTVPM